MMNESTFSMHGQAFGVETDQARSKRLCHTAISTEYSSQRRLIREEPTPSNSGWDFHQASLLKKLGEIICLLMSGHCWRQPQSNIPSHQPKPDAEILFQ
jgi:hypothetical protein